MARGAYHTLHQLLADNPPGMCALLPLFFMKKQLLLDDLAWN